MLKQRRIKDGDIVILAGPTGAGKSYQARVLQEKLAWAWISTGELLRKSKNKSVIDIMNTGSLVDSAVVDSLMAKELNLIPADQTVVLDGYPRDLVELKLFNEFLKNHHRNVAAVILLDISKEVSIARLRLRHRGDDGIAAIDKKWEVFEKQVQPVIDYYRKKNLVVELDGSRKPEAVSLSILEVLDEQD